MKRGVKNPSVKNPKTPGDYMRRARVLAGLSLHQLAELSGVSSAAISTWENGTRNSSLEFVIFVVDALGISIDEYVGHKVAEIQKKE